LQAKREFTAAEKDNPETEMRGGAGRKIPARNDGVWGIQPKSIISKTAVGLPQSIENRTARRYSAVSKALHLERTYVNFDELKKRGNFKGRR
jgi:hypothetical protein